VVIRIAQVNSLITRREEIKRYEDLELEVERKTRELEELEKQNQAAEKQLKIVTIQNAPLEQRIGELELLPLQAQLNS
jgi:cell shape-determining protein MreC